MKKIDLISIGQRFGKLIVTEITNLLEIIQKKCFNYSNLQILDAFTNISLSNKDKGIINE